MIEKYHKAYCRYMENIDIVNHNQWQKEEFLGSIGAYVPDKVNWEFWLNEEAVKQERIIFDMMLEKGDSFPEHSRNFWYENFSKIYTTDEA